MANKDIKIGLPGQEITLPVYGRKLIPDDVEIKTIDIMSDGAEVEDVIGYKRNFTIAFEGLTGPDLKIIKDIYDLHQDLNVIITNEDLTETTYTNMILEPIPQERETGGADWFWLNPVLKLRMRYCL